MDNTKMINKNIEQILKVKEPAIVSVSGFQNVRNNFKQNEINGPSLFDIVKSNTLKGALLDEDIFMQHSRGMKIAYQQRETNLRNFLQQKPKTNNINTPPSNTSGNIDESIPRHIINNSNTNSNTNSNANMNDNIDTRGENKNNNDAKTSIINELTDLNELNKITPEEQILSSTNLIVKDSDNKLNKNENYQDNTEITNISNEEKYKDDNGNGMDNSLNNDESYNDSDESYNDSDDSNDSNDSNDGIDYKILDELEVVVFED